MQSLFFLITTMFQIGINKKITFTKHFARKYIRAYTILGLQSTLYKQPQTRSDHRRIVPEIQEYDTISDIIQFHLNPVLV